ncbi:MAG: hypothetical protein IJM18_09875, partial [Clostridia bacterium]|nr:hypothetical protein [Clostridia bacterium]
YFVQQVRVIASPILHHEEIRMFASVDNSTDLISTYAILAGLSGLLAEKLLLLGSGGAAPSSEVKAEEAAEQ